MTEPPSWAEMTPAEREAWGQQVRASQGHYVRVAAQQAAGQNAIRDADLAASRALIADPTLTADERVARFAADRVRHNDVSLWNDDGNKIPRQPRFKPEFVHIRVCGTLYVDNVREAGINTGHCGTCAQTWYGIRFDAACTCGYRQPGLVWESDVAMWDADSIFAAMDQALR